MINKLERYQREAEQAEQELAVYLDNITTARLSRHGGDRLSMSTEDRWLQNAASWASIYTACKLIIAEEIEAEELRKLEGYWHE